MAEGLPSHSKKGEEVKQKYTLDAEETDCGHTAM
jgi:hypothetical protein